MNHIFLQPQDVLFLRGNKLFGDPGSYGESLIPPWPSVAAGALRSRMMADDPALSAASLQDPQRFSLTAFSLARRMKNGEVETLHPLPADLLVQQARTGRVVRRIRPALLAAGIRSSAPLSQVPVLAEGNTRQKAITGLWLAQADWQRYLQGQTPDAAQLIPSQDLWKLDARVGVGLSTETRRADDGKLFTTQAIALRKSCDPFKKGEQPYDVGFVASANTALPQGGLVRFGGDGRAVSILPSPTGRGAGGEGVSSYAKIAASRRFRLVLTTPGLFPDGWMPPCEGISATLASAAVPRAEVISGWDLAQWQPKPAQRVAPTGSVYWFENFTGSADDLRKLAENGLWGLPGQNDDPQRRAEGFNRCAIAEWKYHP